MKKFFKIFLVFVFLFINTNVHAAGNTVPVRINGKNQNLTAANVLVNNQKLQSSFTPYVSGSRTFVPIRELTEGLGATVDWNNSAKSAKITLNEKEVTLKIDSKAVYVNGSKKILHDKAVPRMATYRSQGNETKTMVPLRFLSEAFGFEVGWDNKTKTASVNGTQAISLTGENKVGSNPQSAVKNQVTTPTVRKSETNPKTERAVTEKVKADGPVTVVLDAGHGGHDSGAIGADGKSKESELNLMVTRALAPKLRAQGYEVIETRSTDQFVKLRERANIAERANAEIFVSIHFNASDSSKASGIEVLYAPESQVEIKEEEQIHLAQCILDEVIKATGAKSRGVKARKDLAVLRLTSMPAALAELGFITNDDELDKILSNDYFNRLVDGVYNGIVKYVDNYVEQ